MRQLPTAADYEDPSNEVWRDLHFPASQDRSHDGRTTVTVQDGNHP